MTKKTLEKSPIGSDLANSKQFTIFKLLTKVCIALSLIAALGLFAGLYDFGFVNLTTMVPKFASALLLIAFLTAASGAFTFSKSLSLTISASTKQQQNLSAKIEEKIAAVEGKVDEFLGQNYIKLMEENDNLANEFKQIKDNESKKNNRRN